MHQTHKKKKEHQSYPGSRNGKNKTKNTQPFVFQLTQLFAIHKIFRFPVVRAPTGGFFDVVLEHHTFNFGTRFRVRPCLWGPHGVIGGFLQRPITDL